MSSTGRQRRGLVLSGGGFFGAFQAGACEGLGQFDCIAGASAGALNGWAIASGMPPAELQRLWLEAAATTRVGLHWPRYWGDGLLNTSILQGMVRALVRDWRPRIDFAVVVSQGWNGQQVLIRNHDIDADAILASCAVPFMIPAKQVRGRLSFDGGLRDACPLWTARAMDAQEIVAVNAWTHLPWWWPGKGLRESRQQTGVTLIEPPQALGALRHSAFATTEQVAAWIEAGRQATTAAFAR
jgi:predicted acylesterase/phospholipase RssA